MKKDEPSFRSTERWAHFRFSVIGALLAAPPPRGQLQVQIQALADKTWRHPIGGHPFTLGFSTIERWYQKASAAKTGPVEVLKRKIRSDHGEHPALSAALVTQLTEQYRQHPSWSYQLHADNLAARIAADPTLGPRPSYASVLRFMKSHGLLKRPRRGPAHSPGGQAAEARFEAREVRSYENPYVNGLWHLDFHHGSRRVLLPSGQWAVPLLLGVLDDHSRLCCHAQWYLAEGAEDLCHGLSQAFQKRGLPRSLLDDNGSIYTSKEIIQICARVGCLLHHTPVRDGAAKGKIERFFRSTREQFLARSLDLSSFEALNRQFTHWVQEDYNAHKHSVLEMTPLERFALDRARVRYLPPNQANDELFFVEEDRTVRADNTFSFKTRRFEAPRHLPDRVVQIRFERRRPSERVIVYYKGERMGDARPLDPVANDRKPLLPRPPTDGDGTSTPPSAQA